jgi:hypothetical protein
MADFKSPILESPISNENKPLEIPKLEIGDLFWSLK